MEEINNELMEINDKSENEISLELEKDSKVFLKQNKAWKISKRMQLKHKKESKNPKKEKTGIFNKGKKIDEIENILVDMANNGVDSVKTSQRMLELQQKQSQELRFVLMLGLSNLASNRATVHFLKEKLENKKGIKLSSIEKEEILSTIKQLKEQEDIFIKQENLTNKVKENTKRVEDLIKENDRLNKETSVIKRRNKFAIIISIISILLGLSGLIISLIVLIK